MENTLNIDKIESYATKVSHIIISDIFRDNNIINAEKIKHLTTIEQINLFIIQDIFINWNEQLISFRSEYFDYDDLDVIEAQKEYMNVVSRHIQLNKEQTYALLNRAIRNCLYILLCPYDFYYEFLVDLKENNKLTHKDWVNNTRYIRINAELKDRIADILASDHDYHVKNILDKSCDEIMKPPEPIEPIFENLQRLVNTDIEEFFLYEIEEEIEEKNEHAEGNKGQNQENKDNKSNEDNIDQPLSLADNLQEKDQMTMNDVFEFEVFNSDIHENISINQRFMFIQELFENDNIIYDKTLNAIDKLDNEYQAQQYLEQYITNKYNWDFESDEVIEFMKIIRLKFQ